MTMTVDMVEGAVFISVVYMEGMGYRRRECESSSRRCYNSTQVKLTYSIIMQLEL